MVNRCRFIPAKTVKLPQNDGRNGQKAGIFLPRHKTALAKVRNPVYNVGMKLTINIDAAHDGKTIKQLFAEKGYSLELIKKFKYDGAIEVNGERKTVRWVLREGDLLVLEANESAAHPVPAETPAVIVYADNYLYLADKPYGINTHPDRAHKDDTLANRLATTFGADFVMHVTTRLDRTTSGLVLGAFDTLTAEKLNSMQLRHEIHKTYLAVAEGIVKDDHDEVALPLARADEQNKTVVRGDGKPSLTEYRVLQRLYDKNLTEVSLVPHTGRTHQLRAHMAAIGHPLLGDVLYGGNEADRIYLHCTALDFVHPITGERIVKQSPCPWKM